MSYKSTILMVLLCAFAMTTVAQQTDTKSSNYDAHVAFNPLFYTQNGNEYRSASGYPGPKYWQNHADYIISADLDEANNKITGSVTITYKNNSPDKLPYLWLQLDQNLFAPESRGNSLIAAGSRYGARGKS
ncbi:hypothetical protein [Pedobacter steynii]